MEGEFKFSKEHEWVQVKGDVATVGITQFAADQLGDIVYVELPEVDMAYETMERVGSIESVKTVSDLFTPVGGTVTELNPDISDTVNGEPNDNQHFEYINQDPLEKGWLFKIKMSDTEDLSSLMTKSEYDAMIAAE